MLDLKNMLGLLGKQLWRWWRMIKLVFPASHYALLSTLFVVGLELIFTIQRWVVAEVVAVVLLVIVGVVLIRIEEKGVFHPIHTILPILATTGISGFAFLLPTTAILHVYNMAAGLVLFYILKHGARSAYPIWSWLLAMVVFFLNIAFILGLRFHLYVPVVAVLAVTIAVTSLLLLQSLQRITDTVHLLALPVLGMSLVITEGVWLMLWLPVHWLVQASVVTTSYYILFNLVSIALNRKLLPKDFIEYMGTGAIALSIVLLSARWR